MVLERLEELDDRRVIETRKNASFDKDLFYPTFVDEAGDEHLLETVLDALALEARIKTLLSGFILKLHL